MGNRTDKDILHELNMRNIAKCGSAIAYIAVVITIGILGNILSFVFYRFNSCRTTTNSLITWLAATDLVTCIVFSDEIIRLCFAFNFTNHMGCWLMSFFNHLLVIISTCLFVIISVDRYRKICRPHHWQLTIAKTKFLLIGVIIFGLITSLRNFVRLDIVASNITDPNTGREILAYHCSYTRDPGLKMFEAFSTCFDVFVFVATFIILAVLYTIILRTLWKRRQNKRQRNTAMPHIAKKSDSTTAFESYSESVQCAANEEQGVIEVMLNLIKKEKKTDLTVGMEHDKDTEHAGGCSVEEETKLTEDKIFYSGIDAKETKDEKQLKVEKGKANNIKNFPSAGKTEQNSKVERNITLMMIVLTVGAILSYVPYFIAIVALDVSVHKPYQDIDAGIQIVFRSFLLGNALRPYVIGVFNTEFRRFVKNLFQRFLLWVCNICARR